MSPILSYHSCDEEYLLTIQILESHSICLIIDESFFYQCSPNIPDMSHTLSYHLRDRNYHAYLKILESRLFFPGTDKSFFYQCSPNIPDMSHALSHLTCDKKRDDVLNILVSRIFWELERIIFLSKSMSHAEITPPFLVLSHLITSDK